MKRRKLHGSFSAIVLVALATATLCVCSVKNGNGASRDAADSGYTVAPRIFKAPALPGFPDDLNRVGANIYRPENSAADVKLVLVSGWSCGAGWLHYAAAYLAGRHGIEVWTVNRRETLFEDRSRWQADCRSVLGKGPDAAAALARLQNLANYARGGDIRLLDRIGYASSLDDIDVVVREAGRDGARVVLGGWSDGVEFVMAYAHRAFADGRRGHSRLAGFFFLDENPEWGQFSAEGMRQKIGAAAGAASASFHEQRWPVVTVFEGAGLGGVEESPLAVLFSGRPRVRMSGQALAGWLYDGGGYDSGWSWLVAAGGFDSGSPVTGWARGEKTPVERLAGLHAVPGGAWEWFYPLRIAADYWEIGAKGFRHEGFRIAPDSANRLPVFAAFSGFNAFAGEAPPAGIQWWLDRTGIAAKNVRVLKLMSYRHADTLLAPQAEGDLWAPLAGWLKKLAD